MLVEHNLLLRKISNHLRLPSLVKLDSLLLTSLNGPKQTTRVGRAQGGGSTANNLIFFLFLGHFDFVIYSRYCPFG